ncbi:MAG TPA: peptidoglycan glycosyltransferase, partial [Clostridiaceae bacterium]|nr:peptidoglycan glycosyltransferase [Clostridiaceae bacterium]
MKGGSYDRNRKNTIRTTAKKTGSSPEKKAAVPDKPSSIKLKKREFFMLLVFTFALLFLIYRIGFIQFVKGTEYQEKAYLNQTQKRQINPKRGTIFDRNGKALAISASVDTVGVNPKELMEEVDGNQEKLLQIATDLGTILDMDPGVILNKFNMNSRYEFIKRKVDKETGSLVRQYVVNASLKSIYIDEDSKRYYPKGSLASHVLGFTGSDDQGLNGIEYVLETTLKGVPGKILNEVDVLGRQVSFSKERYIDAIDGYDVFLTIDETVQYLTEKALDQAILDYNVKNGAAAIVMDPNTGEILAMASKPDFDCNDPGALPRGIIDENWGGLNDPEDSKYLWSVIFRNKAVMDTYEPGSVFKAVTACAAIEENVVSINTPEFCKPITVAGHTINCWKKGGHGSEDFLHAVYNSCNPVFVKTALDLGVQKFYEYFTMFGFREKTGIELLGEPSADELKAVQHQDPKEIDLAVSSFGQRFQITPIQMITAYAAIANGGNLLKPTIIKQISDNDGNIIKKFEPQVVRKVISEETARTVCSILEGVVTEGTGRNAYVAGYRIGGKTGTSQTLTTETEGRY